MIEFSYFAITGWFVVFCVLIIAYILKEYDYRLLIEKNKDLKIKNKYDNLTCPTGYDRLNFLK